MKRFYTNQKKVSEDVSKERAIFSFYHSAQYISAKHCPLGCFKQGPNHRAAANDFHLFHLTPGAPAHLLHDVGPGEAGEVAEAITAVDDGEGGWHLRVPQHEVAIWGPGGHVGWENYDKPPFEMAARAVDKNTFA